MILKVTRTAEIPQVSFADRIVRLVPVAQVRQARVQQRESDSDLEDRNVRCG